MHISTAVVAACSFVSSAYAFCGSQAGSKEQLQSVQHHLTALATNKTAVANGPKTDASSAKFTIPIVWNVFYDTNNPADGNYP